ncbi:MAG: Ig-like domain repeat protein [Solirubrobacteraceae bacterium]
MSETEYARGTVSLSGTASAPLAGVASWTPQIMPASGGAWTNACSPQTTPLSGSTYGCEPNTAGLTDGEYTVRAQVLDNAGNVYDTTTQNVTIDNTAPTGSLELLPRTVEGLVEVKGSAHDALSGVASWQLEIEATGSGTWRDACMAETMPSEETTYSCAIDTTALTDGSYQLHAVISDRAGNTYTTRPISTRVDNHDDAEESESGCSDDWTGEAGDGAWQSARNWSTGTVPGAHDRACIPSGATVHIAGGTNEVASLGNRGELVISGGSLDLAEAATVSEVASLTQSGGSIGGPAVLEVTGSLTWTGGTMEGASATILARGTTSSIKGGTLADRELINEGTLTLEGALGSGWGAPGLLVNTGTLQKAEGAGDVDVSAGFDNEGAVAASSGTFEFTGGGGPAAHSASWSAASGATIVFGGFREFHLASSTLSGAIRISEGARVDIPQIAGADAEVTVTADPYYERTGGTLNVEGPAISTIGTLNVIGTRAPELINSAALDGAGQVDVTKSFTGGTFAYLEGSGKTVIEPGATATVSSSLGLEEEHELENAGTLTVENEATIFGGPGTLINTGTLEKTNGAGTATISSTIENEGLVSVTAGTLELTGGGSSQEHHVGSWSAAAGAKIFFDSTDAFALGASANLSGSIEITHGPVQAGTIHGSSAAVTVNGEAYREQGILEVKDETSTLDALTLNGGVLKGGGTLDVANSFVGENYGTIAGDGVLELQSGDSASISAIMNLEEATLENAGTLTIGPHDSIDGSDAGRIVNSGTLNLNADSPVGDDYGLLGQATLVNTGLVQKTEGSTPALVSFHIDNDGTIDAESGTLEFADGGESAEFASDTWTAAPGAEIELDGISTGVSYSLGATATITGDMYLDDNVTAGTIKGSGASLATLHSILTLTGMTPSELGSLTFLQAEPDYWFPQVQGVAVAGELDILHTLNWTSWNAITEGPGAIVTEPGSTTSFDAGNVQFGGGEFINEGTATWETGGIYVWQDSGTFFVNYGTFQANAQGFEPLIRGCQREAEDITQCPVFENDGLFTADLPHEADGDAPVWPHDAWDVDIRNYGLLEVPYTREKECPGLPPYGWSSEACVAEAQHVRETFSGLLLKEGAEVKEPAWNVVPPTVQGFAEEGETLAATTGTWRVPRITSFSYQWQRCAAEEEITSEEEWLTEPPPRECSNVPGATGSTYAVTSGDEGYRLRAVVAAHTRVRSEAVDSEATNAVAPYELFGEEGGEEEAAETSESEEGEGLAAEEEFIPEEAHGDASMLTLPAFSPGVSAPDDLGPLEPSGYIHYTPAKARYRKVALSSVDNKPLGEWRNEAKFTPKITPAELSWLFVLSPEVQTEAIGPVTEIATTYKMPSKKVFRFGSDFHAALPADYYFHSRIHVYLGQEYQLEIKFSYLCLKDGVEGDCVQIAKQNFKVDT